MKALYNAIYNRYSVAPSLITSIGPLISGIDTTGKLARPFVRMNIVGGGTQLLTFGDTNNIEDVTVQLCVHTAKGEANKTIVCAHADTIMTRFDNQLLPFALGGYAGIMCHRRGVLGPLDETIADQMLGWMFAIRYQIMFGK